MPETSVKSNKEQEQKFSLYCSALDNLKKRPPARKVPRTAREIVDALRGDVVELFANGYSIMDICDALADATPGISSATFKNHVQKIKSSIGNLPKPKRKKQEKKSDIPCDSRDDTDDIAGDSENEAENEAEAAQKVSEKPVKKAEAAGEAKKETRTIDEGSDFPIFSDKV